MLPAATTSIVGIYGTGQAYEQLLLRMRAHPLQEARAYADLMLAELRKVIPAFLKRVDVPERGGIWSAYLEETRRETREGARRLLGAGAGLCGKGPAGAPRGEGTLPDLHPGGGGEIVS